MSWISPFRMNHCKIVAANCRILDWSHKQLVTTSLCPLSSLPMVPSSQTPAMSIFLCCSSRFPGCVEFNTLSASLLSDDILQHHDSYVPTLECYQEEEPSLVLSQHMYSYQCTDMCKRYTSLQSKGTFLTMLSIHFMHHSLSSVISFAGI